MACFRMERVAPGSFVFWVMMVCVSINGEAQTTPHSRTSPVPYQSRHFALLTDLPADEAEKALQRMEETLDFAITCWGRPARGRIECYLIDNLDNWRDANLPHPLARVLIEGVGGVTLGHQDLGGKDGGQQALRRGQTMGRMSRGVRRPVSFSRSDRERAVIYASTDPGVVEHEIMHAYCLQTFGATGPDWYKEGMAELAFFGERENTGVRCPSERLRVLREQSVPSLREVMRTGKSGTELRNSLEAMLAKPRESSRQVSLSVWTSRDAAIVEQTRKDYLWSWALCHLLHHNPTYRDRFRLVGTAYFAQRHDAFAEIFGPLHRELSFEYSQFLQHVEVGYRADLCQWDWNRDPHHLETGEILAAEVLSARGWQAADVEIQAGNVYAYRAAGTWSTGTDRPEADANGDSKHRGRLVGVVFHDYQLGETFPLGSRGSFVAATSGQLYLRCEDAWHELSDNRGAITFRIMRQGSTR